jgi:hypothetical protein
MSLLQTLNLPPPPGRAAKDAKDPKGAQDTQGAKGKSAGPSPKHAQAAEAWRAVQAQGLARIDKLKSAVQAQCAGQPPALVQAVDTGLAKLDAVMAKFDQRLATALDKAGEAADEATRQAELAKAKKAFTDYIGLVGSDKLVSHIDANPFGVTTGLRTLLVDGLKAAAKAIG